jgi:hypothetical protein
MQKTIAALPALDERQRYTIPETCALLRQSRAKTYQDITAGHLRIIKDAKRTYVPGTEIMRRSRL